MYDNGTILIQGIMALQYTAEKIQPLLRDTSIDCSSAQSKCFSNKLKSSLKLFDNKMKTNNFIETNTTTSKPDPPIKKDKETINRASFSPSALTTGNDATTYNTEGGVSGQSQNLQRPNVNMVLIEEVVLTSLREEIRKSSDGVISLQEQVNSLKTELQTIREENKQLKQLTGPAMGNIVKRLDGLENLKPNGPETT